MNIRTIRTSKLAWLQWAMSTILKPAVRAETEWNRGDEEQMEAVPHQVFIARAAPLHHEDQQCPGHDEE